MKHTQAAEEATQKRQTLVALISKNDGGQSELCKELKKKKKLPCFFTRS